MRRWWLVALALGAGCTRSRSVVCADGRVCPEGFICDLVEPRCLTPDQATACDTLMDGELCEADGRNARCDRGACFPDCGDGVPDEGEQCDDANYMSNDGCSSACMIETLSWEQWQDPWRSRIWHAATYDSTNHNLVMFGGYDRGFLDDLWERRELTAGSTWTRIAAAGPSPRQTSIAHDPLREVVVLFGGRQIADLGDTWELDGTTWVQRTVPSPPSRFFHGMVFDAKRGKIVLFGGARGVGGITTALNDTWQYDGGTWTQLTTTGQPSPRANFAMAYDPFREKIVLFGGSGSNGETWELSGSTWTQTAMTGTRPSGRTGGAMAYVAPPDGSPGKLVLFGGASGSASFADTWEYADGTWTQVDAVDHPEGTSLHTLTSVKDGLGYKAVLVGGQTAVGASEQIWEYRATSGVGGQRWTREPSAVTPANRTFSQATLGDSDRMMLFGLDREVWTFDGNAWAAAITSNATRPDARNTNALAYDTGRGTLVLFGGLRPDNAITYGDTWLWDGSTWQDITTSATVEGGPSARHGATAAYDPAHSRIVMFGGYGGGNKDETWAFDGTAWHRVNGSGPPPQVYASVAYDPVARRVVLLDTSGDTYTLDGDTWTKLAIPRLPHGLSAASLTFHPWRRRMIVFGGFDANATLYNELYELADDGWHRLEVAGVGPSARLAASFVVHRERRALVLFGGTDLGTFPGDTWFLKYRSDTADEICDDTQDNDNDGRFDLDDPDCELP